jgi:cytochrome c553
MTRSAIVAGLALGLLATGAVAAGDPATGKLKAAVCSACHGADGNSVDAVWPKLAGQGAPYQMRQIMAIRSQHGRANPEAATMVPMIANLSDEDLADISAFFATQVSTVEAADPDLAEAGRRLYQAGDVSRNIPSCMSCHGPGGRGNLLAAFPQLGGQYAAYSAKQLRAYRDGSRTTDPAGMMRDIAGRLTDADIEAVSEYLSGLYQAGS